MVSSGAVDGLRLGSRESPLALAQTQLVANALKAAHPGLTVTVKTFKTQGDIILDTALSKVGDKGLFVKELEVALLAGEIDLAVHSMKDMPGELPDGLALVSALEREDARDVLISRDHLRFEDLPTGSVIGTSSLRREAQLRRVRPDLACETIRGNLQTRYRKLQEGPYAAIILAAAGVHRLGWQDRISQYFDPQQMIPAVAQGILGLELRTEDTRIRELLAPLQRPDVETARLAERAVLVTLEGGCQLPLGAYCTPISNNEYELRAVVLSPDGTRAVTETSRFAAPDAVTAASNTARLLLDQGAREILAGLRR